MPFRDLRILKRHGRQYIKDLSSARLPGIFLGRPVISGNITHAEAERVAGLCPSGAISVAPCRIDLGRCVFCRECEFALPGKIAFTNDHAIATNRPENLVIIQGEDKPVTLDPALIRPVIRSRFRNALKLRQVSAGGDNSAEMELNAAGNVNFDMGRYGIEFVASPRHADGVVVTGPISANMADALQATWDAVPEPKVLILAGTDAVSGGLFNGSPAIDRSFLERHTPDLYVPGNPPHPLTFILGLKELLGIAK